MESFWIIYTYMHAIIILLEYNKKQRHGEAGGEPISQSLDLLSDNLEASKGGRTSWYAD